MKKTVIGLLIAIIVIVITVVSFSVGNQSPTTSKIPGTSTNATLPTTGATTISTPTSITNTTLPGAHKHFDLTLAESMGFKAS